MVHLLLLPEIMNLAIPPLKLKFCSLMSTTYYVALPILGTRKEMEGIYGTAQ
jgi:ABC-type arginine transport system permease subunit